MKRKNGIVFLSLILIFVVISIKSNAATTPKNWYKKVLNNKSATYQIGKKKYKRSKYKYYKLIDINKDGTKELILSKTKNAFLPGDSAALLLMYRKKRIAAIKSFSFDGGCSLGYNKKNKTIVFYKRNSGSSSFTSYKLKNGKLKKLEQTTYKRTFHDSYPYYDFVYKINGKRTTQNNWNTYSIKMYGSDIGYKKIQ